MNLQNYLISNMKRGKIFDYSCRSSIDSNGTVTFTIQPENGKGKILDYEVHGNDLRPIEYANDPLKFKVN